MRQWRVGSMSMGVLLISLGTILLTSLVKQTPVINHILNWWPIVLIILGVEIVVYLSLAKEAHPKIKYDILSIFLIIVIGIFSLVMYTVSSIGVIPKVTAAIASQNYTVVVPETKISVSPTVKKVEFDLPKASISFKKGEEDQIVIFARGQITAENMEKAEELADQGKVTANQVGDVLYVQFSDVPRAKDFSPGASDFNYTVFLPANKMVEMKRQHYYYSHYYYPIEIDCEAVSNNFIVDNYGKDYGRVKLRVNGQANLTITAVVNSQSSLAGNVDWSITTQHDTNKAVGNVIFGSGSHKVNIVNQGEVEVVYFD
ncbi:MAG: hypothetical protein AB1420_07510 [Bacillota bacterium]